MAPPLPQLLEDHRAMITALAERFRVDTLALFGSAANGTFDPDRSDVDFLVRFQAMPAAERADAYFGLLHELEDLLQCRVDLLEEGAIRNPYLRLSIDRDKRTLYAA